MFVKHHSTINNFIIHSVYLHCSHTFIFLLFVCMYLRTYISIVMITLQKKRESESNLNPQRNLVVSLTVVVCSIHFDTTNRKNDGTFRKKMIAPSFFFLQPFSHNATSSKNRQRTCATDLRNPTQPKIIPDKPHPYDTLDH